MFLSITTLNREACWQDFFCQINDLDHAFAFLDVIVNKGDTLIKAHITDQGSKLKIPVEAFGGEPVCEHIELLKEEWEYILAQPLKQPKQPSATEELHQRLLAVRRTKETHLRHKLRMMQHLLQVTQESFRESERKQRIIQHYQLVINQLTDSLSRLHAQFATRAVY